MALSAKKTNEFGAAMPGATKGMHGMSAASKLLHFALGPICLTTICAYYLSTDSEMPTVNILEINPVITKFKTTWRRIDNDQVYFAHIIDEMTA